VPLTDIVTIEITNPLPETGVVDTTYRIEGAARMLDNIGAFPWVYAEVIKKDWHVPEIIEETSYERGLPMPITGDFTIDWKPEKTGIYEVTVLASPAPLSLPLIGVQPILGKSDMMKITVSEKPAAVFRFSAVTIDGNNVLLTDHDADSGLLLEKTTTDYLDITPAFEWTGPSKTATVSVKAGHKDWMGGFSPKTGVHTCSFTLPESPTTPYSGQLETPIRIPLTACAGISDGAVEIVAKLPDMADYISRIWNVYATKAVPEKLSFDLTRPSVSETYVDPGTTIVITCPIISRCSIPVEAKAKVIIYEGSLMPGHGAKIKDYVSGVFHIEPNESRDVVIQHTTVKGTIDRRDVKVEIYVDTQLVKESEWDDVYYVGTPPEEIIDFNLTRPSVSPAEITPGTPITITCPVTSVCTKEQTATAKILIYEGSLYAGHGTLITTKTSPAFTIAPAQTFNLIVYHTAIAGTIDRRDVEVEIYIDGKLVKESEWDDVYYVKIIELETLEVRIDPAGSGYVTTDPAPSGGTQHNWLFPYGTIVYVTAHHYPGYVFDRWSGEMQDTTEITAPVYPMTEHRLITAHFKETVYEPPTVETLPASSIGGDSADLHGWLVSAGSHDEARCHFEWGKTTSYGLKTPYVWLRPGEELVVKLTNLEPDTTYHFRAVAYTTIGTDYGADMSFKTEPAVVPGFQMRIMNPPAGATQWRAGCVAAGELPYMPILQPLNYVWEWPNPVPDYTVDFWVTAAGPWQDGYAPTIKSYQFPFRLRNDKRYAFDFGAWYPGIPSISLMMKEE